MIFSWATKQDQKDPQLFIKKPEHVTVNNVNVKVNVLIKNPALLGIIFVCLFELFFRK